MAFSLRSARMPFQLREAHRTVRSQRLDQESIARRPGVVTVWLCGLLGFGVVEAATAGRAVSISVERRDEVYVVDMEAVVEAPPSWVFAQITAFDHLERISESIQESYVLDVDDGGVQRVYVLLRICVLFICPSFGQIQAIVSLADAELFLSVLEVPGNRFAGFARWRLADEGGTSTRVAFHSELTPTFWVPPWLGPFLIKRLLEREAIRVLAGLERLLLKPA